MTKLPDWVLAGIIFLGVILLLGTITAIATVVPEVVFYLLVAAGAGALYFCCYTLVQIFRMK